MIKPSSILLKNKGFKITEETENHLVAYNKDTTQIIYLENKGNCMICVKSDKDIRFKGRIDNAQNLNFILSHI